MNILPIYESYSDSLLALGIIAAFDAGAVYHGGLYQFPETADEPIKFPTVELTDERPDEPFTFHKFKASAINSFGGKQLVAMLESQWNEIQPTYDEIEELVLRPDFNEVDYSKTRFWNVKKRVSTSATFRPMQAKGYGSPKAGTLGSPSTGKCFWLLDALRAIGFLTYASPRLFQRESSILRWKVLLPVHPVVDFQHQMTHSPPPQSSMRDNVFAHLIASELMIPRVIVCEYAELNPLARTPMRVWSFEPLDLSLDAIKNLKRITYNMESMSLADEHRESQFLWNALADTDINQLQKFVTEHMGAFMSAHSARQRYVTPVETSTLDEILTCERVIDKNSNRVK